MYRSLDHPTHHIRKPRANATLFFQAEAVRSKGLNAPFCNTGMAKRPHSFFSGGRQPMQIPERAAPGWIDCNRRCQSHLGGVIPLLGAARPMGRMPRCKITPASAVNFARVHGGALEERISGVDRVDKGHS